MRYGDSSAGRLFQIPIPARQITLMLSGLKQTSSLIYSWFCNLAGLSRDGLSPCLPHSISLGGFSGFTSRMEHSHGWRDDIGC